MSNPAFRRTLIIAEAGVNHNGDLAMARQLIDAAVAAGADMVKFQTFRADKLVSRAVRQAAYQTANLTRSEGPVADTSQYAMLRKLELDEAAHHELIAYCQQQNIRFCSTAFDLESVDTLRAMGVDLMKIPSGDITNRPYLEKIGATGLPIVLSTGMANLGEIEVALDVLFAAGARPADITVLHCNTEYPTPMPDVNLKAMNTIGEAFGIAIGYSDHTLGIEVPIAAVAMGAVCIEKHLTLDRTLPGPDHAASLEPDEFRAMVTAIRNIETALGDGRKRPSPSESRNVTLARRSVHLVDDLHAGHVLTADDLVMKRPGDGISPMAIDTVLGRRLAAARPADYKLTPADLL